MKKSDLKGGMIVELRDGKRYLFNGVLLLDSEGRILMTINYNEDLRSKYYTAQDIVKVYKSKNLPKNLPSLTSIFQDEYLTMIWDRKEIKLTNEEIEILKALKTLDFEWLRKDINGRLYAYEVNPNKVVVSVWVNVNHKDLFNFITCEDEESTKIDDLLKEHIK